MVVFSRIIRKQGMVQFRLELVGIRHFMKQGTHHIGPVFIHQYPAVHPFVFFIDGVNMCVDAPMNNIQPAA